MNVVLRPEAERDIEEAIAWYEAQRTGLGAEFVDAVSERLVSIAENPEAYSVIMKETRRALLRRFPYGLFYLVETDRVVVMGCFHARLSPRRWAARK